MTQKQRIGGALVAAVVLVAVGAGVYAKFMAKPKQDSTVVEDTKQKRRVEQLNQISVDERPYMVIQPDGTRNLKLSVMELKKPASSVEYELEYQAGSLLQGAFGQVELANTPATADILLGSCSAGGACTYHEDVKGGTLLLRFEADERYALKQDWKYIQARGETEISSKDAKFQLSAAGLAKSSVTIIYNTPGYPGTVDGRVVSEVYSLQTSAPVTGTGTLTMRAAEEGALTIMGYDGSAWESFETQVDGKTATAEVPILDAYVVVVK